MSEYCIKALVGGKVQGVWYRRATQQRARQAGVTGHARNLADGRVEVLLCGPREAVEEVCDWLWQGPPEARVRDVEREEVRGEAPDDFTTG